MKVCPEQGLGSMEGRPRCGRRVKRGTGRQKGYKYWQKEAENKKGKTESMGCRMK